MTEFHKELYEAFREPVLDEMPNTDEWSDTGVYAYAWELIKDLDSIGEESEALEDRLKLLED